MAQAARVTSLEALETFKALMCKFGTEAGNALCGIELQIRRAFEWLEDQQKFWQREVRRREELVSRAKNDLIQRQYRADGGRGPGTTEQEKALEEALEMLQQARDKVENCKHWTRALPREVIECQGPSRQLTGMLEADLKHAVALLDRKIKTLEAYVAIAAPSTAATAPGTPKGDGS
jgi:hypothetical protein